MNYTIIKIHPDTPDYVGSHYEFSPREGLLPFGSRDSAYVSQTMMSHIDHLLRECIPNYDVNWFIPVEYRHASKLAEQLNIRALELDETILLSNVKTSTKCKDWDKYEYEGIDTKLTHNYATFMRELAHWIEANVNEDEGMGIYGM